MSTNAEETALAVIESQPLSRAERLEVAEVISHSVLIGKVMEHVMKVDMHYGTIPGTKKPTLYQPGAQVLALTFQLRPEFEVIKSDLGNGHREIEVKTSIKNRNGEFMGHGLGSCSTMESKYRYRSAGDYIPTGQPVPKTYWGLRSDRDRMNALRQIMDDGKGRFGVKNVSKVPGTKDWQIVQYPEEQGTVENPNIADTWNTVLKMAKKRSYVDAILNCTGASDVFTQDMDDLEENLDALQSATGVDHHKPVNEDQERTQPEERREAGTWRDTLVHVKCTMTGKKLGELTLGHLKSLKKNWVDAFDFTRSNIDDRKLRKAIAEGLGELETAKARAAEKAEKEPAQEQSNEQPADSQPDLPTQGTSAPATKKEKQAEGSELKTPAEEYIAKLRVMLTAAELGEEDFIEELAKHGGWPLPIEQDAPLTLDVIEDGSFLEMICNNFKKYLEAWGFTKTPTPAPAPEKKKKAPAKKK